MAITIVKRPEKFTPSGNPVTFQISTDNADILYFRLKLYVDNTTTVINQCDIFPTPQVPIGSYINLSRLLDNVVSWEVNNASF